MIRKRRKLTGAIKCYSSLCCGSILTFYHCVTIMVMHDNFYFILLALPKDNTSQ